MRVVSKNSAAGKNTAKNRLVTRSYSFCSGSERLLGTTPVGMMAKWSLIFALLKMRLFGRTQPSLRIFSANPPSGATSRSESRVCRTVAT